MYGVPHIATGDMLREMRELDTPVARELRAVLDRGDLVDDELMIDLIRERLSRGDTVVGFVPSVSLMLFVLIYVVERRSLVSALAVSIGVTVGSYVLFSTLLKSPLPPMPFWS